ncbi:MAG: hypothetical protein PHQ59_02340 [Candidatus Daviesbacteria bacterium]|nr:hypothetical protein [Candidatus Daviesbacteria bacterium]
MEIYKPLDEPCDLCKNWRPVTEVCPGIVDRIPDITGHMCSQNILNRQFCSWSIISRFEPLEEITFEQLKGHLTDDVIEGVKKGITENRRINNPLKVIFGQ